MFLKLKKIGIRNPKISCQISNLTKFEQHKKIIIKDPILVIQKKSPIQNDRNNPILTFKNLNENWC